MLKTFMADLAEPLKHDCNISLPHGSFYQDVPTAYVSTVCVCVTVCVCAFMLNWWYHLVQQPEQYTTTLLSLLFRTDEGWSMRS